MTKGEAALKEDLREIGNPLRLAALRHLQVLGDTVQPAFGRLVRLAAAALNAPLVLIAFIDAERELCKGALGLPATWEPQQELSLASSFCKYPVMYGQPVLVEDIRHHPLLSENPVARELGIAAYIGVPLSTTQGYNIGTIVAGDYVPRRWSDEEVDHLKDLAALLMTELELRCAASERLRAEAERDGVIEQLRETLQGRERFLSIAAHELRTPLTSLLGSAQLLQRHLAVERLPERDRRLLDGIIGDVYRLERMIESLLDVSRAQSGRLRLSREPLDLEALVWRIRAAVNPASDRERLNVVSLGRPLMVLGDEQRLRQVLDHLLQNALAYSPAPSPIEIRVEERGDAATVAVSDRGIGIPKSARRKLFSPFYRAPNVRAMRAGGLGVGLFLVKELMSLHDGGVEVTSEEYEGSTFRIYLPLYRLPASVEKLRTES